MPVPVAVVEVDKANSALDHPARQQAHSSEVGRLLGVQAVQPVDVLGLPAQVDQFGTGHLHAEGQFVVPDPGRQAAVVRAFVQVSLVPLLELAQDGLLVLPGDRTGRLQIFQGRSLGGKHGSLVDGRQEARSDHRLAVAHVVVGHHHVGRQVVGFAPQAVEHPGAHAGLSHQQGPRVDDGDGGTVDEGLVVAGADDREVVGEFRELRKQVGDFQPGLAVLPEYTSRPHQPGFIRLDLGQADALPQVTGRKKLAVIFLQLGLWIEGFELAGAALQEDEDDAPGLGREVGGLDAQGIVGRGGRGIGSGRFRLQHAVEGQSPEPQPGPGQEFTPRTDGGAAVAGVGIHGFPPKLRRSGSRFGSTPVSIDVEELAQVEHRQAKLSQGLPLPGRGFGTFAGGTRCPTSIARSQS